MANPAADFPTSVHTAVDTTAFSTTKLGSSNPVHTDVHGKIEQEIVEIQKKIGVGESIASTATDGQVLTKQANGETAWEAVPSDQTLRQDLDDHVADLANPHQVTAAQVGADQSGSASTVQDNLDDHESDINNPHNVTAIQVSIVDVDSHYTGTDVETALEEIASGTILDNPYLLASNNLSDVVANEGRANLDVYSTGESDNNFVDVGGDSMNGPLYGFAIVDTKENIIATTPDSNAIAFGTDTGRFYFYDGTNWQESAIILKPRTGAKDIGYEQNSSLSGYGEDYISRKRLSNVSIGGNNNPENGAIRIDVTNDPDTFEIYLRGEWQTVMYDLTYETDDFRHIPLDFPIQVWSGNSVQLGNNGLPLVQEYQTSRGAYPVPILVDGGSF